MNGDSASHQDQRKIVHVDLDCFYAAIEERDHPELRGKPVGVGGSSGRGVLTTANYKAREYGCRSAMPVFKAKQLCPQIILMPVRFDVYRAESAKIRAIFGRFTDKIEPLSLDEAYLDLSHWKTSAATLAREIRSQIEEETGLTASAGIAPNKLIAKIASDWHKPNGQFEVRADECADFMAALPVGKLWGVGKKGAEKLTKRGFVTCGDLLALSKFEMADQFGRFGVELYDQIRGIDHREVKPNRIRKSLSSETTFRENIGSLDTLRRRLTSLIDEIQVSLAAKHSDREIRSLVVKMKFEDFTRTTAERANSTIERSIYDELLTEAWGRGEGKAVRLIGAGVRFVDPKNEAQLELL